MYIPIRVHGRSSNPNRSRAWKAAAASIVSVCCSGLRVLRMWLNASAAYVARRSQPLGVHPVQVLGRDPSQPSANGRFRPVQTFRDAPVSEPIGLVHQRRSDDLGGVGTAHLQRCRQQHLGLAAAGATYPDRTGGHGAGAEPATVRMRPNPDLRRTSPHSGHAIAPDARCSSASSARRTTITGEGSIHSSSVLTKHRAGAPAANWCWAVRLSPPPSPSMQTTSLINTVPTCRSRYLAVSRDVSVVCTLTVQRK